MIRALLKKQLLELGAAFVRSSKTGKRRSRAGAFGYALLFAVLMLLVMLSFGSMALPLAVTLVPQGLDWLYFVLMELSALTVSVLASAFTSYGHLFRCRDNQQLLALPIPPGAIFAVRCGGVYLTGLIYLLLAWVPSVVCYALAAPCPGGALLAALPVALALAGVSMVLAVLLGWAVALLNRRARHKSLVTVVGTLLFLAVYYAVFQWVGNAVDALALDLSFSVREFKDIIKEMQNGVYGEDYRAVPGSTNMTYIMISQNRRENLKEGYRQLTGGISGNVSGGAGNGGMWIVPYFIDEREEVFPAGMTDSMDFTAWEVDRNDG